VLCSSRDYFVYVDANCENLSPMARYCYRGNDWRTVGYFSATAALIVFNRIILLSVLLVLVVLVAARFWRIKVV